MFTRNKKVEGLIDSVFAAEGTFKIGRQGIPNNINVVMVYTNSQQGDTYGQCTASDNILSQKSIKLFQEFLQEAESDFGKIVFEGAANTHINPVYAAPASMEGLPKGLGELDGV